MRVSVRRTDTNDLYQLGSDKWLVLDDENRK